MANYHWKLVRQNDQTDWPEMAANQKDALKFLNKKAGVELEVCNDTDSYDFILERHHAIENGVPRFLGNPEEIFYVREKRAA